MRQKGSITVFLSLILAFMISLEFTLVEIVHWRGLQIQSNRISTMALENVFSQYNVVLWEKYGILVSDIDYGNRSLVKFTQTQLQYEDDTTGMDFYRIACLGTELGEYCLITDGDGKGLVRQGASAAKKQLATEVLESWKQQADELEEMGSQKIDIGQLLAQGEDALSRIEEEAAAESKESETEIPKQESNIPSDTQNPIEVVRQWKEKGTLSLVVARDQEISSKVIEEGEKVSLRQLSQGNGTDNTSQTIYDRLLFQLYLLLFFQNYGHAMAHEGLSYEMEYILCGKDSDQENIEGVVERLLGLREVSNYMAILKDPGKMGQAMELAVHFAGVSANPALIKAVQLGIAAAWAFMESILDVRLLLTGGKVAFVKNTTQWTSQLLQLPSYLDVSIKAKECENGLDYQACLMALMCLYPEKTLAFRAMDLMENELHRQEDYVNVKLDHMYYKAQAKSDFEGQPMFFSLVREDTSLMPGYTFHYEKSLSYLDDWE